MSLFGFLKKQDVAIDLGTTNVLVYVEDQGIVLNEPSVIAMETGSKKIVALGLEARNMLGRTPGNITAVRPLREGAIADYDATANMIQYFVKKVIGKSSFQKPRIMMCIPSGVTDVERRAVLEATTEAGGGKVYLIEEPLAAALGAGIDIQEPRGNMIIDIGGGTTDIAVLSLGGIVKSESIRVGGDRFDDSIVRYVKKEHNLLIGEQTAEKLKIQIGTAKHNGRSDSFEIRGRDLVSGLPRVIRMTSGDVYQAISESIGLIVGAVKLVLETTPPELSADIIDRGIVITGGGALLHKIDQVISEETGIPVVIAEDPLACVALGSGKALDSLDILQEGIMQLQRRRR